MDDERTRRIEGEALHKALSGTAIDLKECSALTIVTLMEWASRSLVMDQVLGVFCALEETKVFIERMLGRLEQARKLKARPVKRTRSGVQSGARRRSHETA